MKKTKTTWLLVMGGGRSSRGETSSLPPPLPENDSPPAGLRSIGPGSTSSSRFPIFGGRRKKTLVSPHKEGNGDRRRRTRSRHFPSLNRCKGEISIPNPAIDFSGGSERRFSGGQSRQGRHQAKGVKPLAAREPVESKHSFQLPIF